MRIVRSPDGTSESRLDATRLAAAMDAIGVTLGGADLHELLEEGGFEESGELTLDWNGVSRAHWEGLFVPARYWYVY